MTDKQPFDAVELTRLLYYIAYYEAMAHKLSVFDPPQYNAFFDEKMYMNNQRGERKALTADDIKRGFSLANLPLAESQISYEMAAFTKFHKIDDSVFMDFCCYLANKRVNEDQQLLNALKRSYHLPAAPVNDEIVQQMREKNLIRTKIAYNECLAIMHQGQRGLAETEMEMLREQMRKSNIQVNETKFHKKLQPAEPLKLQNAQLFEKLTAAKQRNHALESELNAALEKKRKLELNGGRLNSGRAPVENHQIHRMAQAGVRAQEIRDLKQDIQRLERLCEGLRQRITKEQAQNAPVLEELNSRR